MRKRKYILNLFAAAALFVGCSESLEDTYSDYSGDGNIHYVAKCRDLHAIPGWERLVVEWVNGTDATIENIKIVWSCEDRKDSVSLPKETTSFELKNLTDGNYRFDICAVDKEGNESLKETTYARPYTRDHEVMLAFSRGVLKTYFLDNSIVFFSDQWNENIDTIIIQYKNTQKEIKEYGFDKETSYGSLISIMDVSTDPADSIYILRKGKVEDCPDIIEFEPIVLNHKKTFSAGFAYAIQRRYGYSIDTKENEEQYEKFINEVEELEIDYNIETFEDILYCPNLKKLVLGKNRYFKQDANSEQSQSQLMGSMEKSIQVLDKANELLGLEIEYYGHEGFLAHYFGGDDLPYMTYKGYPQLPELDIIDKEAFKPFNDGNIISCIPTDLYAELDNLLDDNPQTVWVTTATNSLRNYEMLMEFKEVTEIRGVKVTQPMYYAWNTATSNFVPSVISIQTSIDGAIWENLTFFEANDLGEASGEVTLMPVHEGTRQVRYIKFNLRDKADSQGSCKVNLGDILIYK